MTRQRYEPKRVEQVKTVKGGPEQFHNCEHASKVYEDADVVETQEAASEDVQNV